MIKLVNLLNEINLKQAVAGGALAASSLLPFNINDPKVKNDIEYSNQDDKKDDDQNNSITLNKFLKALHYVESGGKEGAIIGDNGRALGPLQIHKIYWNDVKDKVGGRYQDVVDYDYSKKVVIAYFLKYAKEAFKNKDWEKLAKIHNGGPKGYTKKATEHYWQKVKAQL